MKTKKLLRHSLTLVLFTLSLVASGCGVLDFDIEQPVPEQRIMSNLIGQLLGTLIPSPFALNINFEQETKARGTGPVKAAGLKSLTFDITATAMQGTDMDDFDFVQSVDIYIESTRQGSTLQRVKIADLPGPPGAVKQMDLRTYPDVNLLPYINEGSRITSMASGMVPTDDVTFNGKIVVRVNTL
jgi:hypothetical protein